MIGAFEFGLSLKLDVACRICDSTLVSDSAEERPLLHDEDKSDFSLEAQGLLTRLAAEVAPGSDHTLTWFSSDFPTVDCAVVLNADGYPVPWKIGTEPTDKIMAGG